MITQKLFIYGVFGFFLFLIVDWLLNEEKNIMHLTSLLEGVENQTTASTPASASTSASTSASAAAAPAPAAAKCPEDCKSITELKTKMNTAIKEIESMGQTVSNNMIKSMAHQSAISDMNKSIDEMQKNKKDE